jgi:integration host factor subunit beta
MTTRSELTYRLASRLPQLNESDAKLVVDSILTAMTTALSKGERIELRGFGSFSLVHRRPRKGRNPKTGEAVAVAEKSVVRWKMGKEMREGVDTLTTP